MASFFRRHIPNFSTIVEPLTRLTKKECKFLWGEEQQRALEKIKHLLSSEPALAFPDYSKPFHIFTDASLVGQGGALMQKDANGAFKVIAYCSRTLSASERKWPPVQVELSAIIFALREFRGFIYLSEVELHSDHKPLSFLLKKADSAPNLARWLIELQNYNIKIVHVNGKENSLADALSRVPENAPEKQVENLEELEDIAEFPVCLALNLNPRIVLDPFVNSLSFRGSDGNPYQIDLVKELHDDPEAKAFLEFLINERLPDLSEKETESFVAKAQNLKVESGILYFHQSNHQPKIYVPISLRSLIFDAFHTSPLGGGHMSVKKTLAKMRKFFWPKMYTDVISWTRQCVTCQLKNSPYPAYRAEMSSVPANTIFAKVGLDITGPVPMSEKGNKYILNAICWFSKFVISIPIPDTKSLTVARAIVQNVYLKFGGCTHMVTDNGTTFSSEFFRSFCKLLYINKSYSTPHYSQGNAATERTFRTFHAILSKYLDPRDPNFEDTLDCATFAYNTSIHETTRESPFFLMYGRDPIFNIEHLLDPALQIPLSFSDMEFKGKLIICLRAAWQAAAEATQIAQQKMKQQYDKLCRPINIEIGDKVLLKNYIIQPGTARKWQSPWRGIFRVIGKEPLHLTIVSCASPQSKPFRVHINQVKKLVGPTTPACTTPRITEEERHALEQAEAVELDNVTGYSHDVEIGSNGDARIGTGVKNSQENASPQPEPRYNLRQRVPRATKLV